MGSLASHVITFLILLPLSLHRLHSTLSLYLNNPSLYRSKPWFFSQPKWKSFDLYTLLVALPIASFSNLFFFLTLPSTPPTYRFDFLNQSLIVFLFWILLILILVRENFNLFLVPDDFLFVFASILFIIEYMMMGFEVDRLSGRLTLVCGLSCLYLSVRPSAFWAEFLLSSGIFFKGMWALQVGLSFYTDKFGLKGCNKIGMGETDIKCDLEEDKFRAIALMDLIFIIHTILVFLLSFGMLGLLCHNRKLRCNEASGALLAGLENESVQMRSMHEYELD